MNALCESSMKRSKFSAEHAAEFTYITVPNTTGPEKATKPPMRLVMHRIWSGSVRLCVALRHQSSTIMNVPLVSAPTRIQLEMTCVVCDCACEFPLAAPIARLKPSW